jgi:endonuclease/exonuclease/phosphatase family metal-dependent hydrolase
LTRAAALPSAALVAAAVVFAAMGNACGQAAPAAIELRVMSFNIEWGGTHVSFDSVVRAIVQSNADIVAVQEPEGNLGRLAAALGWHHDPRAYVVSRFPLLDPSGAEGDWVLAEVVPEGVVAIASTHLPSDPYGPHWVVRGADPAEVLALERSTRLPAIVPLLPRLSSLAARGVPVFLAGDFNAPSHADWVAAAVGTRPHVRYELDWPVSLALAEAGLRDSWRQAHPDPVVAPGLTWWAARPPVPAYLIEPDEPQDRIDFIWYGGPASVRSSELVGEPGVEGVVVAVDPWPSDHRAVLSTFSVRPAPLPDLVSSRCRVCPAGEPVRVVSRGEGQLRIVAQGGASDGEPTLSRRVGPGTEELSLPADLPPGRYRAALRRGDASELERVFWVQAGDETPRLRILGSSFAVGEPIPLRWSGAPGYRNDYVAAYAEGVSAREGQGMAWAYLGSLPDGDLQLDATTSGADWPLPPGTYVLRLLEDDGYRELAVSERFVVRAP